MELCCHTKNNIIRCSIDACVAIFNEKIGFVAPWLGMDIPGGAEMLNSNSLYEDMSAHDNEYWQRIPEQKI